MWLHREEAGSETGKAESGSRVSNRVGSFLIGLESPMHYRTFTIHGPGP